MKTLRDDEFIEKHSGINVHIFLDPDDIDLSIANIYDFTEPECDGIFLISKMDKFKKTLEGAIRIP